MTHVSDIVDKNDTCDINLIIRHENPLALLNEYKNVQNQLQNFNRRINILTSKLTKLSLLNKKSVKSLNTNFLFYLIKSKFNQSYKPYYIIKKQEKLLVKRIFTINDKFINAMKQTHEENFNLKIFLNKITQFASLNKKLFESLNIEQIKNVTKHLTINDGHHAFKLSEQYLDLKSNEDNLLDKRIYFHCNLLSTLESNSIDNIKTDIDDIQNIYLNLILQKEQLLLYQYVNEPYFPLRVSEETLIYIYSEIYNQLKHCMENVSISSVQNIYWWLLIYTPLDKFHNFLKNQQCLEIQRADTKTLTRYEQICKNMNNAPSLVKVIIQMLLKIDYPPSTIHYKNEKSLTFYKSIKKYKPKYKVLYKFKMMHTNLGKYEDFDTETEQIYRDIRSDEVTHESSKQFIVNKKYTNTGIGDNWAIAFNKESQTLPYSSEQTIKEVSKNVSFANRNTLPSHKNPSTIIKNAVVFNEHSKTLKSALSSNNKTVPIQAPDNKNIIRNKNSTLNNIKKCINKVDSGIQMNIDMTKRKYSQ